MAKHNEQIALSINIDLEALVARVEAEEASAKAEAEEAFRAILEGEARAEAEAEAAGLPLLQKEAKRLQGRVKAALEAEAEARAALKRGRGKAKEAEALAADFRRALQGAMLLRGAEKVKALKGLKTLQAKALAAAPLIEAVSELEKAVRLSQRKLEQVREEESRVRQRLISSTAKAAKAEGGAARGRSGAYSSAAGDPRVRAYYAQQRGSSAPKSKAAKTAYREEGFSSNPFEELLKK